MHFFERLVGGFGQTLSQHASFAGSGGSGHLPLHAGQLGGAPDAGHTVRHAGFFGSNVNSSHVASGSGMPASFGGSGISTFVRSVMILPASPLNSTVSLYLPASPRLGANTRMKYLPFASAIAAVRWRDLLPRLAPFETTIGVPHSSNTSNDSCRPGRGGVHFSVK